METHKGDGRAELSEDAHLALLLAANTYEPTQLGEDPLSYQSDLRHIQKELCA